MEFDYIFELNVLVDLVEFVGLGLFVVVVGLCILCEVINKICYCGEICEFFLWEVMQKLLQYLQVVLFFMYYGYIDLFDEIIDYFVGSQLNVVLFILCEQVWCSLYFSSDVEEDGLLWECVMVIMCDFVYQLLGVCDILVSDIQVVYYGDLVVLSILEILLCYFGIMVIIYYCLVYVLYQLGVLLLVWLIVDIVYLVIGIDIYLVVQIGLSFFIDYGIGVVIGEIIIIGCNVCLYQVVMLGVKCFLQELDGLLVKGIVCYFIVEDDVVVYVGVMLLGCIIIG